MKKMTIKRQVCIVMAFLLMLSMSACGTKTVDPVEITMIHGWGSTETDHVRMRSIYSDFEKENPDVKIHLVSMPTTDEVVSKVEDMLTVGEVPDVVFTAGVGQKSIYEFMVEQDLAVDFMPYMEADEAFMDNVAPGNINYWETEDGKLYTISDVLLLSGGYWYNEDIFRAAGITQIPATWDEFYDVYTKIASWAQAQGNGIEAMRILDEGCLYLMDQMLAGMDGKTAESISNNRMEIHADEFTQCLSSLQEIYDHSSGEAMDYSYRDATSLFNEGKTAMYINGVWGASMISDDLNVKYATFPTYDGKSMSSVSACLGYIVGNSKEKEKVDASIRFVKYMMSKEVQERILIETGQVPANPNISAEDYKLSMPRFYQAVSTVQSAEKQIETPENLWDGEKSQIFKNHIMEVLAGKMKSEDFVKLLQ